MFCSEREGLEGNTRSLVVPESSKMVFVGGFKFPLLFLH